MQTGKSQDINGSANEAHKATDRMGRAEPKEDRDKDKDEDILVFDTREQMGLAAATAVATTIETLLQRQAEVRIIFAAAPSQKEMLYYLSQSSKVDWERVVAFHMDEYIGLAENAPASFASFLTTHLFHKVPFKKVYLINNHNNLQGTSLADGEGEHSLQSQQALEAAITRYQQLLAEAPIDIVCLGIGENRHLAFNDPPVADFNDPRSIKIVRLDDVCRTQQVHDGMFKSLEAVPEEAVTLTIPTLLSAKYLFCVVPGVTKQKAVYATFRDPVSEQCPSTILRQLPEGKCRFYFDNAAYGLLQKNK